MDILHANRKNPDFPATIMLTGAGNEEVAVRALKAGVYDYLRKQSLDKQELKASILKAYSNHNQEIERKKDVTQQGKAFNKSLFYQQLEFHKDIPGYRDRVLLYLELDNNQAIVEREGVILRDNIVRHIAKQSYEIFNFGECNPSVTRLGDIAIALLIDMPDSRKTLEFNLNGLLNHLKKHPFKFDGRRIEFNINIGAVELTGDGESKDIVLGRAKSLTREVSEAIDISYKIYDAHAQELISTPSDDTQGRPDLSDVPDTPDVAKAVIIPEVPDKSDEDIVAPELIVNTQTSPSAQAPKISQTDLQEKTIPADKPELQTNVPSSPPAKPVAAKKLQTKPSVTSTHASLQPVKPRKSLDELKAELERAKTDSITQKAEDATIDETTTAPSSATEVTSLDISSLDDTSKNLFKEFEEKRIILSFQPVITLLNDEVETDDEIHYVGLQHVNNTNERPDESLRSKINSKEFQMYIDRWILREIIGTLSIKKNITDSFIVNISDASLADASFFTWFRTMLTGLDSKNIGKYILLEIDAKDLVVLEKQASALISYLRKSHHFSFVLGTVTTTEEILSYTNKIKFDFLRCNSILIKELQGISVSDAEVAENDNNATHSQLDLLKSKGTRLVADDIIDSTTLTDVISLGSDYAMGEFIGEPVTQLDDVTNIESFEIV